MHWRHWRKNTFTTKSFGETTQGEQNSFSALFEFVIGPFNLRQYNSFSWFLPSGLSQVHVCSPYEMKIFTCSEKANRRKLYMIARTLGSKTVPCKDPGDGSNPMPILWAEAQFYLVLMKWPHTPIFKIKAQILQWNNFNSQMPQNV